MSVKHYGLGRDGSTPLVITFTPTDICLELGMYEARNTLESYRSMIPLDASWLERLVADRPDVVYGSSAGAPIEVIWQASIVGKNYPVMFRLEVPREGVVGAHHDNLPSELRDLRKEVAELRRITRDVALVAATSEIGGAIMRDGRIDVSTMVKHIVMNPKMLPRLLPVVAGVVPDLNTIFLETFEVGGIRKELPGTILELLIAVMASTHSGRYITDIDHYTTAIKSLVAGGADTDRAKSIVAVWRKNAPEIIAKMKQSPGTFDMLCAQTNKNIDAVAALL